MNPAPATARPAALRARAQLAHDVAVLALDAEISFRAAARMSGADSEVAEAAAFLRLGEVVRAVAEAK